MKSCFNMIKNNILSVFGKLTDAKRYDGLVVAVKFKDQEKYGYLYIHHAYHNMYRGESLSFIGYVFEEGLSDSSYENANQVALTTLRSSDFDLFFINNSSWLKHNMAYLACCRLRKVKNQSHYHKVDE